VRWGLRGKGRLAQKREREMPSRPTATFTVAVDLLRRGRSASASAAGLQLHGGEFLGSERKRKGDKWAAEGCSRGVRAF
jgi:hypothetical protein